VPSYRATGAFSRIESGPDRLGGHAVEFFNQREDGAGGVSRPREQERNHDPGRIDYWSGVQSCSGPIPPTPSLICLRQPTVTITAATPETGVPGTAGIQLGSGVRQKNLDRSAIWQWTRLDT
jgi:hypothetical protein